MQRAVQTPQDLRQGARRTFDVKVRTSILQLACLLILVCVTVATMLVLDLLRRERDRITSEALAVARAAAHAADREVTAAWALMSGLSTSPLLRAHDYPGFEAQLRATPKPDDSWIVVIARDGQLLVSSLDRAPSPLPRVACTDACAATFATREPQISDMMESPATKRQVVRASMPVVVGDDVPYVLAMPIPSAVFNKAFEERRLPPDWIAGLYDRNGVAIARSRRPEEFVGRKPDPELWAQIATGAEEGVFRSHTREGVPALLAFRRAHTGWIAVVGVPLTFLNATPIRVLQIGSGAVAALLLAGLGVAWRISRRIEQPMRNLTSAVAAAEQEKAQLENLYSAFWANTDENLFVLRVTDDGRFLYEGSNPALERSSGFAPAELYGKEARDVLDEDVAARCRQHCHECIAAGAPIHYEERISFPAGTRDWEIVLVPVRDERGAIVRLVGSGRDITHRKRTEADIRTLLERVLRAEDEERRRIARELHDCTAQHLVGASLLLSTLEQRAEDARPVLAEVRGLIRQSQDEIRTLSYLMYPPTLAELGLNAAIRSLTEGLASKTGLQIDLELPSGGVGLPHAEQLAIFRVLQEALTNVHRHAQASRVRVRLIEQAQHFELWVIDNGKGTAAFVEQGRLGSSSGLGLVSMTMRVQQMGGRLRLRATRYGTGIKASMLRAG